MNRRAREAIEQHVPGRRQPEATPVGVRSRSTGCMPSWAAAKAVARQ
ncbi:MAG: hypothetical protein R3F39_07980 [Myxococcota bacterium]